MQTPKKEEGRDVIPKLKSLLKLAVFAGLRGRKKRGKGGERE